jgi:glycosyltransferase involved in cell wall biosynthesis
MKVLMLNTFDEVGGAARAAFRLQKGMRELGVDSTLLVHFKSGDSGDVVCNDAPWRRAARSLKLYLGLLPVLTYPHKPENNFSPALLPDGLAAEVAGINPDILHLHWLGAGFCRVETLAKFKKPLVWTLHDSWAFTGGCHVPFECTKYREQCGACPVLGSSRQKDLSRWTWKRKEKAWRDLELTLVAPSHWLADCARSSSLFRNTRVEVIPNGIDTEGFRPRDKKYSRDLLRLPPTKKIILFGAMHATTDRNKGFHLLQAALQKVGNNLTETMAVVFGSSEPADMPDLGMPVIFLGRLKDEHSLAAAYAAADVFVVPSIQEAFCQTAAEALACGTPVVAFRATGLLDVVEHQGCGYLARPYDVNDLAQGIAWVLQDPARHAKLSAVARQIVETKFARNLVARQYAELYRDILGNNKEGR